MCDGAGFDALWLEDRLVGTHDASPVNALTTLAAVAPEVRRARLGAMLDPALRSPWNSRPWRARLTTCSTGGSS